MSGWNAYDIVTDPFFVKGQAQAAGTVSDIISHADSTTTVPPILDPRLFGTANAGVNLEALSVLESAMPQGVSSLAELKAFAAGESQGVAPFDLSQYGQDRTVRAAIDGARDLLARIQASGPTQQGSGSSWREFKKLSEWQPPITVNPLPASTSMGTSLLLTDGGGAGWKPVKPAGQGTFAPGANGVDQKRSLDA